MAKSTMKKLTIAIPTFNRKKHIRNIVQPLLDCITKNELTNQIDLLIVDNCSDMYNIYDLFCDIKPTSFFKIIRNISNIGAGANFLRCIELADSEYVWLLGDDEILDLTYVVDLLNNLGTKDLYLLPHNDSYAKNANYFGCFSSVDELLDRFWNLGSFFVLSIYIFNKNCALKYLKIGYEAVLFQHPYSAMALSIIDNRGTVELIKVPILKIQNCAYVNPRFDMVCAFIDVVNTVKLSSNDKQFRKYLQKDFYPAREQTVFSLNIGITKPVNIEQLISNYKRLISLSPSIFSKISIKSLIWIILAKVRRSNKLTTLIIFIASRFTKNTFSDKPITYIHTYDLIRNI